MSSDALKIIENLFSEIVGVPSLKLTPSTTPHDVPRWDSLNHVKLVVAVEEEFSIEFSGEEMDGIRSIGDILALIEEKIGKSRQEDE